MDLLEVYKSSPLQSVGDVLQLMARIDETIDRRRFRHSAAQDTVLSAGGFANSSPSKKRRKTGTPETEAAKRSEFSPIRSLLSNSDVPNAKRVNVSDAKDSTTSYLAPATSNKGSAESSSTAAGQSSLPEAQQDINKLGAMDQTSGVERHGAKGKPAALSISVAPEAGVDVADEEEERDEPRDSATAPNGPRRCKCKRSMCLKLYCECFAANQYCTVGVCSCHNCFNTTSILHKAARAEAISFALEKNPVAFTAKTVTVEFKGCKCQKSGCLKKYCDCYALGKKCTSVCRCTQCKNQ